MLPIGPTFRRRLNQSIHSNVENITDSNDFQGPLVAGPGPLEPFDGLGTSILELAAEERPEAPATITEGACWTHVRRTFFDISDT